MLWTYGFLWPLKDLEPDGKGDHINLLLERVIIANKLYTRVLWRHRKGSVYFGQQTVVPKPPKGDMAQCEMT